MKFLRAKRFRGAEIRAKMRVKRADDDLKYTRTCTVCIAPDLNRSSCCSPSHGSSYCSSNGEEQRHSQAASACRTKPVLRLHHSPLAMVFYEPGISPHGMAKDPFKSTVVPRPMYVRRSDQKWLKVRY